MPNTSEKSYTIDIIKLKQHESIPGKISETNSHYFILSGKCHITTTYNNDTMKLTVDTYKSYDIVQNVYIEIVNPYEVECTILQINFKET